MAAKLKGQSLRRLEDARFLTGRGRFIEDIDVPGQAWMHVVRSPHAHATITRIDTEPARTTPGVLGVFTAADLADLGPLPCNVPVASLQPMIVPPRRALATGRARHVGDPVAFVVAETRDAARNAAEADRRGLRRSCQSVVDAPAALAAGAPQLWDQAPGNLSYRFQKGDAAAVQAAIAGAAHVVELELVNNRIVICAMEPRGAIGTYDDAHGFHLQYSGAGVHALKSQLADSVFRVPPERMRVSCPDVGGGFGVKNALYPEWVMLLWAARHLGRPVKWLGERAEDFVTTAQGRANVTRARLALDADGNFLALDVATVADLGAYLSTGGPGSSTNAPVNAMGSGYVIPAIFMDVRGAFTNTVPIDAYRGAGKPEVNYMIERLIDAAARRFGFDPIELRRRNLVAQFPYRKALGTVIDCGRFAANLDDAVRAADHAGFAARRDAARARGMLRGIGVTCFMETARGAPNEGAEIRFDDDGKVALLVGTQSNGMGHETTYPQIAADLLGLPIETFRYVQADTALVRDGNGHGGARSMHMGGAALCKAVDTMLAKGSAIAARLLQASPAQVAFADGRFIVRDDPSRGIDLLSVARAARDPANLPDGEAPGLDTYVWNLLDLITYPERLPHRRGGNRSRNRRGHAGTLHRGGRFRHAAEPDADAGADPGRRRAGHRPGDAGAHGLRSGDRPDAQRLVHGLRAAARRRSAVARHHLQRRADRGQSARRERLRPGRRHRRAAGGHLRDPGRAGAAGVTHIDMPATPERIWRALQGP